MESPRTKRVNTHLRNRKKNTKRTKTDDLGNPVKQAKPIYTKFHDNGTKKEEYEHMQHKKIGKYKSYHDNEHLYIKTRFTDGKITGKFQIWFKNTREVLKSYDYRRLVSTDKFKQTDDDGFVLLTVNNFESLSIGLKKDITDEINNVKKYEYSSTFCMYGSDFDYDD